MVTAVDWAEFEYEPPPSAPTPANVVSEPREDSDSRWRRLLRTNEDGKPTNDPGNAALILTHDPRWRGCLQYDEFTDRTAWAKAPPDIPELPQPRVGEQVAEHHVTFVQHWLAKFGGARFNKQAVQDAMMAAARANQVDSLRDYLSGLEWDGVERLSSWLSRYLGAPDTAYIHSIGRRWLISAVARALKPGCQADHVLVLEGEQGAGKSSALRILGGRWYLPSLPNLRDEKAAAERVQGKWLVEIDELDAMRGAAATLTKSFLTRTQDTFRPAYGRFTVDRPRRCVFAGTTNEQDYLTDPTGARRFWPVRVTRCDAEALEADRDQLIAEAVHAFNAGEPWWPSHADIPLLSEEQEQRHSVDEWEGRIATWCELREDGFTIGDVLGSALSIDPGKWDRSMQTRVGNALRRLGFKPRDVREGRSKTRKYYRA